MKDLETRGEIADESTGAEARRRSKSKDTIGGKSRGKLKKLLGRRW